MKLGILTYHAACNFGANLQTLSTVSYLKNRGVETHVINWYPTDLEQYYKKIIPREQIKEHTNFIKQYLPTTERCLNSTQVRDIILSLHLDAVIIGSDAVFSYIPFYKRVHPSRKTLLGITKVSSDHSYPNPFWADFKHKTDNIKVFAMSASAQYLDIDKCLPIEKKNLLKAIHRFNKITVRDRWTKNVLYSLTGTSYDITPDPVFAFNSNVKNHINKTNIVNKFNLPDKYIVISFCNKIITNDWMENLNDIIHQHGFSSVNLAMPEGCQDIKCDYTINTPLSPIDWYNIIRFSNGYIGQRMHPLIVAFHNLVPFFIFDHYAFKKGDKQLESSKIYDLLERSDCLCNYHNIKSSSIPTPQNVFNSILNFNIDNAQKFVNTYLSSYHNMMNQILESI